MKKVLLIISSVTMIALISLVPMLVFAAEKVASFKFFWSSQPRVPKSLL